ncbi:MAG: hypothetical protein HQL66_08075 [Magnetococcales bacterium]|nr:hypothetical protein [Magnetococcales bacterium]
MDPASTQPPRLVRTILLLLPPLVALAVWVDGQRYDPGLLDFQNKGGAGSALASALPEGLGSLKRIGPLRGYTQENLYEYIDGHADFFIGAGFRHLTVGDYGPPGAKQPSLVVDLYDMGEPLHAFGVLSDQKGTQSQAVNVGDVGFLADQTLAFIKGSSYVRLAAFGDASALVTVAGQLAARLPAQAGAGGGITFSFPDLGKVGDTRFIKENYRGMPFFNNVVERTFTGEQGENRTAFLIPGTPEETTTLEKTLHNFLTGEKIVHKQEDQGGAKVVRVTDPYEGDWIFAVGRGRFLGLFGTFGPEQVQRLGAFMQHK